MKKLITKTLGLYLNILAIVAPRTAGEKGFKLFCRPFRAPLNEKQRQFFNTADKFSIVTDDGVTVQGYKWGRGGKKILFLHGWQSHTYRWKQYIEDISFDDYTVYSIDAPGHGLSGGDFLSVPVYSKLIQKLIIELGELHAVVGHSLGGFSLLHTIHTNPLSPIARVVLLAPPGEAFDFFTFYQQTLGLSSRAMKQILDYFENAYGTTPHFFSGKAFAASLHVPALIIHDQGDDEAPYRYAEQIQQAARHARLHATTGLGHNLRSIDVVREVTAFVTQEDLSTGHSNAVQSSVAHL